MVHNRRTYVDLYCERLDASFWAAVNGPANGTSPFTRIDRQRVKVWLNTSFDQLAKLGEIF